MFGLLRRRRRRRLMEAPLPPGRLALLEESVPHYRILPEEGRRRLQGLVQVFLAEMEFEGCGGMEITDEVRLTVAGRACLLLVGRQGDVFSGLRTILVYPSTFYVPDTDEGPDGTVSDGMDERYGESWEHGAVVLSWDEVSRKVRRRHGSLNVVLHEFAHQLDEETGSANGAPALPDRALRREWAAVMGDEYAALAELADRGRRTPIDDYAAESPAEFFAVLSEYFFERPIWLRGAFPEIYDLLARCYGLDVAALAEGSPDWNEPGARRPGAGRKRRRRDSRKRRGRK